MSSTGTSWYESDSAVDALTNFMSDIFDDYFIQNIEVRRDVARMILASGKMLEITDSKYDFEAIIKDVPSAVRKDPFDMVKHSVHVTAGLNPVQQSRLRMFNPDMDLTFSEINPGSHSIAYAQRIVDTARALDLVDRKGNILDLGGNQATHAMRETSYLCHSCGLRNSHRDLHRNVQREVNLEIAGRLEYVETCTDGAENCFFQAVQGICIHALPDVDPNLIPVIFKNHGLEFMTGVHHYDTSIALSDHGYMQDMELHWLKKGGHVEFHFDNDSSHPYSHREDWLTEYSHNWTRSMEDWNYVVYYQVDYIQHGVLKWNMTRIRKDTLGDHSSQPAFQYYDREDVVELFVPKFDPSLGKPITDPTSYIMKSVITPRPMFLYLYQYGVANDTERPDLPLTEQDMKAKAQTYNYVRTINGTPITTSYKLSSEHINDIALGMYLLVVRRAAQNAITYGKFVGQMRDMQKQWGDENLLMLATKVVSSVAFAPFMLLARSVQDVLNSVGTHMRGYLEGRMVLASTTELVPYRVLPPIAPVSGLYENPIPMARPLTDIDNMAQLQEDVPLEQFYNIFKDTMDETTRGKLEKQLQDAQQADDVVVASVDSANSHFLEFSADPTHDEWKAARRAFDARLATVDDYEPPGRIPVFKEGSDELVMAFYAERIYEHAMYCVDSALHVASRAVDRCRDTWGYTAPNNTALNAVNDQYDAGAKYFRVVDGIVQGMNAQSKYDMCIDPINMRRCRLRLKGDDVKVVGDIVGDYVFVTDSIRIFNQLDIARRAVAVAKSIKHLPKQQITVVDGIFGCGKTHQILQRWKPGDIILCAVRDTAEQTRAELLQLHPDLEDSVLQGAVRTIDSANMHGIGLANTLFVDEAMMVLPGAILQAAYASDAQHVCLYGDSIQIGFIDRGSSPGALKFPTFKYFHSVSYLNTSFRVAADALYFASQFYPEERRPLLKTASNVKRSFSVEYVSSDRDPAFTVVNKATTYASVLQADKGKLLRAQNLIDGKKFAETGYDSQLSDIRPVYSVHEMQGRTYPMVQINRLNVQTVGVFASAPHQVVSTTRHMLLCPYKTMAARSNDKFAQELEHIVKHVTDEELETFMTDTPPWLETKLDKMREKLAKYLI